MLEDDFWQDKAKSQKILKSTFWFILFNTRPIAWFLSCEQINITDLKNLSSVIAGVAIKSCPSRNCDIYKTLYTFYETKINIQEIR